MRQAKGVKADSVLYFRVRYIDTTKVATFITEKIFRYTKVFFVLYGQKGSTKGCLRDKAFLQQYEVLGNTLYRTIGYIAVAMYSWP